MIDRLSIAGVLIAILAIFGGNFLEGGHIDTLLNSAAALIVIGGTIGAGLLQTAREDLVRAFHISRWVFRPPQIDFRAGINKVVSWSLQARRQGLLGLEKQAETELDPFLKKGLQMIADGNELDVVRNVMEVELHIREQRDLQAAKFYEAMGGYAPTIGIIGAVLGLIQVMSNLSEPDALGSGIATAFVATIYGVGFANLILLPIASKLRAIVFREYQYREMMLDGMLSIVQGQNPIAIRVKLDGYLQ